jgi:hypothetical protein
MMKALSEAGFMTPSLTMLALGRVMSYIIEAHLVRIPVTNPCHESL